MNFLEIIAFIVALAAAVTGFALIRGNNRWNRLLGYNVVSGKVAILIVLWAAISNNYFYLDIAIIYILLSFIGVTALSDYLVDTGRAKDIPLVDSVCGPDGAVVVDSVLNGNGAVANELVE